MRYALYSLLTFTALQAGTLSSNVLSPHTAKNLELDRTKVEAQASIERDTWLSPITASYTASYKTQYGYDQENYTASIGINQPIFKSGGIYFAIKYANAHAHYNRLGVTLKRNGAIKQTIELVMKLQQSDLSLKQLKLDIEDAQKELKLAQDSLDVGEIDMAELNKVMITLNSLSMSKLDQENLKRDMVYQLSILSDKSYDELELPKLTIIDQASYLKNNLNIEQSVAKSSENDYWKKVRITEYLPAVTVQAKFNYSKGVNQTFSESFTPYDVESSYSNYGFSVSMPLFDINMLDTIESARVDAIKSKIQIQETQKDEQKFYQTKLEKVRAIEEKKSLAIRNYNLYEKILMTQKNSFETGDSNELELQKVQHSWEKQKMDIQKIYLDQQMELLALYEKLYDI